MYWKAPFLSLWHKIGHLNSHVNLWWKNLIYFNGVPGKDGSKVTTVVATPGQGPDRPQEVSYADMKLIGNGSFGVVYQAKLCDTGELIAIKKVLQDKRFKVSEFRFEKMLDVPALRSRSSAIVNLCDIGELQP